MTRYGRTYTTPIFHIEKANNEQITVFQAVIDALLNCGIDFCVVHRADEEDALVIKSHGCFSMNEKSEILKEVVEMYKDSDINHISME